MSILYMSQLINHFTRVYTDNNNNNSDNNNDKA